MNKDTGKEDISNNAPKKENKSKIIVLCSIIGAIIAIVALVLWLFNRTVEVVFNYNNGSSTDIVYVKYNTTIPKNDIKTEKELGPHFTNWYEIINRKDGEDILAEKAFDFNKKIDKNVELKAVYDDAKNVIEISFDSRGGSAVDSLTIEIGASLVLPANPIKSGYTFNHWETTGEIPITDGANVSESMTLYAVWTENTPANTDNNSNTNNNISTSGGTSSNTIVISFDSRGGTPVPDLTIDIGASLVLPANPTKNGYTFNHWETSEEIPITDGANLSESMTLYAVWE